MRARVCVCVYMCSCLLYCAPPPCAELLDFGYPQVTSADLLKLYIYQQGVVSEEVLEEKKKAEQFTIQATGAVAHRREGIKYKRNEVFIDVVESVNLLVSHKGRKRESGVRGPMVGLACCAD